MGEGDNWRTKEKFDNGGSIGEIDVSMLILLPLKRSPIVNKGFIELPIEVIG